MNDEKLRNGCIFKNTFEPELKDLDTFLGVSPEGKIQDMTKKFRYASVREVVRKNWCKNWLLEIARLEEILKSFSQLTGCIRLNLNSSVASRVERKHRN